VAHKKRCKVFVSYSRHGEALIKPLAGLLGAAVDDAVFFDVTSLKPGDLWDKEITAAITESLVFVLCWCCQGSKSKFVAKEMRIALKDKKKRLVPVLLCAAKLPASFARRQWIDLRGKVPHECESMHHDSNRKKRAVRKRVTVKRKADCAISNLIEGTFSIPEEHVPELVDLDRTEAKTLSAAIKGYFRSLM
jgi:TIR domain